MPDNEAQRPTTRQMGTGHAEPATEQKQVAVTISLCIACGIWLVRSGAPFWFSLLFTAWIALAVGLAVAGLWPVVFKARAE